MPGGRVELLGGSLAGAALMATAALLIGFSKTAIGGLAVIAVAMWRFGGEYFGLVGEAARFAIEARSADPPNPASMAAYDAARGSWHTMAMSVLGLGGIALILWLMMFKPF
jgi:hypothetical protein